MSQTDTPPPRKAAMINRPTNNFEDGGFFTDEPVSGVPVGGGTSDVGNAIEGVIAVGVTACVD
jgi:hypothetical protein